MNLVFFQNCSYKKCIRKLHFASCLFTYICNSKLREHEQKLHIAYLTCWYNSIFGYKLRTIEAENP